MTFIALFNTVCRFYNPIAGGAAVDSDIVKDTTTIAVPSVTHLSKYKCLTNYMLTNILPQALCFDVN